MDFGSTGVDINLIEIELQLKILTRMVEVTQKTSIASTQINNWKVWIHNNRDYFIKQIYNLGGEKKIT